MHKTSKHALAQDQLHSHCWVVHMSNSNCALACCDMRYQHTVCTELNLLGKPGRAGLTSRPVTVTVMLAQCSPCRHEVMRC